PPRAAVPPVTAIATESSASATAAVASVACGGHIRVECAIGGGHRATAVADRTAARGATACAGRSPGSTGTSPAVSAIDPIRDVVVESAEQHQEISAGVVDGAAATRAGRPVGTVGAQTDSSAAGPARGAADRVAGESAIVQG